MTEQPTILLIEDSENDRMIALRALRKLESVDAVEVARDGQEALEMLALGDETRDSDDPRIEPRVIFLDLKMPRIDGWEVLREIRRAKHTRDIPVVILSASDREDDVRECYRLGANSFLVKRFDAARPGAYLAEAARYWIDLNRSPAASRRNAE